MSEDIPEDLKLTKKDLHSKHFRHRDHSLEFKKN